MKAIPGMLSQAPEEAQPTKPGGHTLGAFPSLRGGNKGSGFSGAQQREWQNKTRMKSKVGDGIAKTISKIYEEKMS